MTFSLIFSQIRGNFPILKEDASLSQPCITFKVGAHKTQTKALKSMQDVAVWSENYAMHNIPSKGHGILEVVIQDHRTLFPDSTIGTGTANMAGWSSQELMGLKEVTVPLVSKKGRGIGEVTFLAKHSNYTVEAAQRSVGAVPVQQLAGKTDQGGRRVDGVGAGTTYEAAKEAASRAAAQRKDIVINRPEGIAAGKPVIADGNLQYEGTTESGLVRESVKGGPASPKARGPSAGEVIDRKYYVGTEDRPQEQALVERFREHQPFVRHYETTVIHTGRERLVGSKIETLGTQEHVVDTKSIVSGDPQEAIARVVPNGSSNKAMDGDGWVQGERGPICSSQKFEITGDIAVEKKRVTNLREHRDFEKEFEIATRFIEEVPENHKFHVEQLSRDRVLRSEKPKDACEGAHPLESPAA